VFLQDLGFDSVGLARPASKTRQTVNVASTTAEEAQRPRHDQVAVYLSKASKSTVTAYLTAIGSTTGKWGWRCSRSRSCPARYASGHHCVDG